MKTYLKIIGAMAISLFVTSILNHSVFIAGTPHINQNFGGTALARVKAVFNKNASPNTVKSYALQEVIKGMKTIAPGVDAASKGDTSYTHYNLDNVEWAVHVYTLKDGSKVTIRVPKGVDPPSQSMVELMNQK